MNVARPLVHGFEDDLIDQLDDTGLLRGFEQVLAAGLDQRIRRIVFADHLIQRVAAKAVVRLDDLLDLLTRGEHGLDVQTSEQAQIVERIEIERITRRHLQDAVHAPDGHEPLTIDHARRQGPEQLAIECAVLQRDQREVKLLAKNFEQLPLREPALLHHRTVQPEAFGLLKSMRLGELLFRQQAPFQQDVCNAHGCGVGLRRWDSLHSNQMAGEPRPRAAKRRFVSHPPATRRLPVAGTSSTAHTSLDDHHVRRRERGQGDDDGVALAAQWQGAFGVEA